MIKTVGISLQFLSFIIRGTKYDFTRLHKLMLLHDDQMNDQMKRPWPNG